MRNHSDASCGIIKRHPERIPFRVAMALVLPWAPSIDATHLLMAPMSFFQADTLKMTRCHHTNQVYAHPQRKARVATQYDEYQCMKVEQFKTLSILRAPGHWEVDTNTLHATFQELDKQYFSHVPEVHEELCVGWSDMFCLPLQFWKTFASIAEI